MAAISIDKVLGIHDDALKLRAYRTNLLASNMANADTPNYKARDIDFQAALQGEDDRLAMYQTHPRHLEGGGEKGMPQVLYRVPHQPSLDGNTVDPELEKTAFAEHTLQHQATLDFLDGRIKGLKSAMKEK